MTGRDCDEPRMAWVLTCLLPMIATWRFSPRLRTSDNGNCSTDHWKTIITKYESRKRNAFLRRLCLHINPSRYSRLTGARTPSSNFTWLFTWLFLSWSWWHINPFRFQDGFLHYTVLWMWMTNPCTDLINSCKMYKNPDQSVTSGTIFETMTTMLHSLH